MNAQRLSRGKGLGTTSPAGPQKHSQLKWVPTSRWIHRRFAILPVNTQPGRKEGSSRLSPAQHQPITARNKDDGYLCSITIRIPSACFRGERERRARACSTAVTTRVSCGTRRALGSGARGRNVLATDYALRAHSKEGPMSSASGVPTKPS